MTKTTSTSAETRVLATDLDGTLIPLSQDPQNQLDLATLKQALRDHAVTLVFVTGRHFASVAGALEEFQLPRPAWIICDVGTSIFQLTSSNEYQLAEAYQAHLRQIIDRMPISALRQYFVNFEALRIQEDEKQGEFKLSFYADAGDLSNTVARAQAELDRIDAPYSMIHSVDPFNGDGLIDFLPSNTSKAHALRWWCENHQLSLQSLVFAGDSGNDLAALTAGHRAIVVGNADQSVIERARKQHEEAGWTDRLYLAKAAATSGVLEGCRHFRLFT